MSPTSFARRLQSLGILLALLSVEAASSARAATPAATPASTRSGELLNENSAPEVFTAFAEAGAITTDAMRRIIWSPVDGATYAVFSRGQRVDVPANMVYVSSQSDASLPAFCIGRYEVTNAEYKMFLDDALSADLPSTWTDGTYPVGQANHPVIGISRDDALGYCEWVAHRTGWRISLPTMAQQMEAARGARVSVRRTVAPGATRAVGADSADRSVYGSYDLAGGAREWTLDKVAVAPDAQFGFRTVSNLPAPAATRAASAPSGPVAVAPSAVSVAPAITRQPFSQTVVQSTPATFRVIASADGVLSFQWFFNGNPINGGTASTFTIASAQPANVGSYVVLVISTVTVTDINGQPSQVTLTSTSNPALLSVELVGRAPQITTQPASRALVAGTTASFTVAVSGTSPLTYRWQVVPDSTAQGQSIPAGSIVQTDAGESSTLTASSTTPSFNGTYTVTVSNAFGSVTSVSANLVVIDQGVAPAITTQPIGKTVTEGSAISLTVVATGTPAPTLQWAFNNAPIAGATQATLTLASAKLTDAGGYTVTATNPLGSVTSTVAMVAVNKLSPLQGGSGGAPSTWFLAALTTLALLRASRRRA